VTDDSALATACVSAGKGRLRSGGRLKFFWGPMDCGKSTLALQMDHNHSRQGRHGLILTRNDRSMGPSVTTRIGLRRDAIEVTDELHIVDMLRSRWAAGQRVDYLICDEACFYTVDQIEQLVDLVDDYDVDVYAFGLAADFRSRLFPAARRLFELADEVARLQVEVLCWCGREGSLNARIVDGTVAREGEQVVIGDTADTADVRYQVLCRRHYRAGTLAPDVSADLAPIGTVVPAQR
jgi:thymidine kinase